MERFHLLRVVFLLSASAVLSSACARQPAQGTPDIRTGESKGAMSARELTSRLVAYAKAVTSPEDASAENFRKATLASFTPFAPGEVGGTAERQPLAEGYTFFASFTPSSYPDSIPIHQVFIYAPGDVGLAKQGIPDCLLDADAAGRELEAAGYRHEGDGVYKGSTMRNYRRTLDDSNLVFDTKILTYSLSKSGESRSCLSGMHFSGGEA